MQIELGMRIADASDTVDRMGVENRTTKSTNFLLSFLSSYYCCWITIYMATNRNELLRNWKFPEIQHSGNFAKLSLLALAFCFRNGSCNRKPSVRRTVSRIFIRF